MNMTITRTLSPTKLTYVVYQDGHQVGTIRCDSNTTYGIALRKINLVNSLEGRCYDLKQENILMRIVGCIPPISTVTLPNFILYINGVKCGYTRTKLIKPDKSIMIKNHEVSLHLHANNYVSVMCNEMQIALIHKKTLAVLEQYKYDISYNNSISMDFVTLLTAFVDVTFFRKTELNVSGVRWEKTIELGKDKYADRLKWRPEE